VQHQVTSKEKFTDIVETEAGISQALQIMKKRDNFIYGYETVKKILCFLYASGWPMKNSNIAKCSTMHFTNKRIKLLDQKPCSNKFYSVFNVFRTH